MKIHGFSRLITNSSSEAFVFPKEYTVEAATVLLETLWNDWCALINENKLEEAGLFDPLIRDMYLMREVYGAARQDLWDIVDEGYKDIDDEWDGGSDRIMFYEKDRNLIPEGIKAFFEKKLPGIYIGRVD
jgi:hypothetical protein